MATQNTKGLVPIVSLGDGTWVLLDERPTIMFLTQEQIDNMDDAPINCEEVDVHIHIDDLVNNSHWNDDHSPIVSEES